MGSLLGLIEPSQTRRRRIALPLTSSSCRVSARRSGHEDGLRIIDLTDPQRATPVIASDAAPEFSWSPDGEWIAYYGSDGLWLVRPTGVDRHLLAAGYEVDGAQVPEWSPDSTKIALSREIDDAIVIDVIDVATGTVRTVTPTDRLAGAPRWSPDGTRILVGTHVVGADGSGLLDLIDDPTASEDYAASEWSLATWSRPTKVARPNSSRRTSTGSPGHRAAESSSCRG